tara:strand:+ start:464 stop:622 length:159 start_codon:yes stop_codon:yes gene_type:complete
MAYIKRKKKTVNKTTARKIKNTKRNLSFKNLVNKFNFIKQFTKKKKKQKGGT